jgi:6-phosphogluconolactonase
VSREVLVATSADELAAAVAARAFDTLAAALGDRPVAHFVITGGGILEQVLAALAEPEALDWARVHVWWGDERYVPADSDDRNDRPAMAKLLDRVPVDPAHLHRMPAADAGFGDDVDAAADSYAAELAEAASGGTDGDVPAFDLVLLGVGPDGHCCSLFPDHPGTRVQDTSVIAVRNSPKPPPIRLSLSFRGLNSANEIWVIASGDGKADAVAKALSTVDPVHVPSSAAEGRERTLWLVDEAAAAKLPDSVPRSSLS